MEAERQRVEGRSGREGGLRVWVPGWDLGCGFQTAASWHGQDGIEDGIEDGINAKNAIQDGKDGKDGISGTFH